jgi:hypothetical protein
MHVSFSGLRTNLKSALDCHSELAALSITWTESGRASDEDLDHAQPWNRVIFADEARDRLISVRVRIRCLTRKIAAVDNRRF